MTIQRGSWSWDRTEYSMSQFFSAAELVETLASTSAWNGTLIMNIGPTADGLIPPIFQERLGAVGGWLHNNSEAIYGTRPWAGSLPLGTDAGKVYYTAAKDATAVYVIACEYPAAGKLQLTHPKTSASTKVTLLFDQSELPWTPAQSGGMTVSLPPNPPLGSSLAWALKLEGLSN